MTPTEDFIIYLYNREFPSRFIHLDEALFQGTFDEIDLLEFVMVVEDHYGIEITDEEIDSINTLACIANIVDKKIYQGEEE